MAKMSFGLRNFARFPVKNAESMLNLFMIRQDNNGIADVRTFSTWTTALQDAQTLVDEVCLGYPEGEISDEERVFDDEECCWQTPDGLNHVFLYETELRDE